MRGFSAWRTALLAVVGWSANVFVSQDCLGQAGGRPRIIRPPDDRKDYFEVSDALQGFGDAVCAFVSRDSLIDNGDGTFELDAVPLSEDQEPLCADEPFGDQPTGAFCTGSLIGPDLVVTAGHCLDENGVRTPTFDEFYFVFDYIVDQAGASPTMFTADQVYTGIEIIGLANVSQTSNDWAVVRLDRPVTGRTPLSVRTDGELDIGRGVTAIGFGAGLPMKFSGNATVQGFLDFGFEADLDIIEGNSGGPVIDSVTGQLEGVISADLDVEDFYMDGECRRATRCPGDPICDEGFTAVAAITNPEFQEAIRSVLDVQDLCPDDPDKTGPGVCGCGTADDDADTDGVVDCDDLCPDTAQGAEVDEEGCEVAGPASQPGLCGAMGMIALASMLLGLVNLRRFPL